MAFLASDVTARVREERPAFYPDSNPMALAFVNEAHVKIVQDAGLYAYGEVDISLVANMREYLLDPLIYRIQSATYFYSETGFAPIFETSVDELDYRYRTWRNQGTGKPHKYYEQGGYVGFFRTPDTTTGATYPFVRLNVLTANRLASLASTLPAQTPLMDAWVYQTLLRWATAKGDANDVQLYAALSHDAMESLKGFTTSKLVRQKPYIAPRIPRITNP